MHNSCAKQELLKKQNNKCLDDVPGLLCEEQTNSTLRGSWMFEMLTVPLQGCRELKSPSFPAASPDSELLSSLSLLTSASRAERFSPATNISFTLKSNKQRDNKKSYNAIYSGFGMKCKHIIILLSVYEKSI